MPTLPRDGFGPLAVIDMGLGLHGENWFDVRKVSWETADLPVLHDLLLRFLVLGYVR